ncbi:MAG: hypothetical protein V1646_00690 [bacterium]
MKFLCKFLIFILCLNVFNLFSMPSERETYLRQLSDIYYNPDITKTSEDESYKEEPLVGFLIDVYSSDIKSFNQMFEHFILKREKPDPFAMFILQRNNLLIGDDILPCVKKAFKLCKKIVKSYCKDKKRDKLKIILASDNIIYILAYALAVGKEKDASVDPTAFRNRKRRTFGTLRLSILVPMIRAGEIRSFEDVLNYMAVYKGNTQAQTSYGAASLAAAAQSSFRDRRRSLKKILLKN